MRFVIYDDNRKSPIENPQSIQRVALVIQYLGTNFHGWQRQQNQRTVQEEIETAISTVLERPVTLHAAGRTDAGVHATAQVAHFDAQGPIPAHRWASVLNSRLAKDILIRASAKVEPTWHARFSASWVLSLHPLYEHYPTPNLFVRPFAWHCYHAPVDESLIQTALTPLMGGITWLLSTARVLPAPIPGWTCKRQSVSVQGLLSILRFRRAGFCTG